MFIDLFEDDSFLRHACTAEHLLSPLSLLVRFLMILDTDKYVTK